MMISQRPGDVLEVRYEGSWCYLVVVTRIFMFGGNVVYAFHSDGSRIENFEPNPDLSGFNICTDLLLPKKEGEVNRIGKVDDPIRYRVSDLIKDCHEHVPGQIAKRWFLSRFDNLGGGDKIVRSLSKRQALAMDSGMYSFDLVVEKILSSYTPDKNPFIGKTRSLFRFGN